MLHPPVSNRLTHRYFLFSPHPSTPQVAGSGTVGLTSAAAGLPTCTHCSFPFGAATRSTTLSSTIELTHRIEFSGSSCRRGEAYLDEGVVPSSAGVASSLFRERVV